MAAGEGAEEVLKRGIKISERRQCGRHKMALLLWLIDSFYVKQLEAVNGRQSRHELI